MKNCILTIGFICLSTAVFAQSGGRELSIDLPRDKQLIIVTEDASIDYVGYKGDKLLVSALKDSVNIPLAAKGLKKLTPGGEKVSDSIAYSTAAENNRQIRVRITGNAKHLLIRVPQDIFMLSILANSLNPHSTLTIKHINTQFDVHALMKSIEVSDVTGPFSIESDLGEIILKDIHWYAAAKWNLSPPPPQLNYPYIIRTRISDIKIFAGNALSASFLLKAPQGRVYSDLKLADNKDFNGGGVSIFVETDRGNIYLQK